MQISFHKLTVIEPKILTNYRKPIDTIIFEAVPFHAFLDCI